MVQFLQIPPLPIPPRQRAAFSGVLMLLMVGGLTSGCFLPPPLELEADGGGSTAPAVLGNLTRPNIETPFTVQQTAPGAPTQNVQPFNLALRDPDSDKLNVRFFVDGRPYDQVVGQGTASNCSAPAGCSLIVQIQGLCDDVVNNLLGTHIVEAYIVDLPWSDRDKDDLTLPEPGGFRTNVWWRFECIAPVDVPDAGLSWRTRAPTDEERSC